MSLKRGVLRGVQTPRVHLAPKAAWSEVDDAAFLASSYGLTPDPWQEFVLADWLARDSAGRWASGRCGLAVPRQNGKNGALEIRELFGMVMLGEKFLHTAHEVKTARKAFRRLKYFFGEKAEDPSARFPELNARVSEVRNTNGQEAIILKSGASVEFVARSRGSGRGFTVDVLVLDEAQELTDEQYEALKPTISSAPLGNPQEILTGTPPSAYELGVVFARMRAAGVEGKAKRMSWSEWSVPGGDVDIYDPQVWAMANPALGIRLLRSVVEDELPPAMSVDGFCRERLGRWLDELTAGTGPFPPGSWNAGIDSGSSIPDDEPVVFGLDVTIDRSMTYIAVAGKRADGLPHVEVVAQRSGTDWARGWFAERASPEHPLSVVVQARGAAASSLIDELSAVEGLTVVPLGGSDLGNSTGILFDLVRASGMKERDGGKPVREGLCHLPQPVLDTAAMQAVPKILDGGGMTWDRKRSPAVAASLMAVTGALWGLMQDKSAKRSFYEDHDLVFV